MDVRIWTHSAEWRGSIDIIYVIMLLVSKSQYISFIYHNINKRRNRNSIPIISNEMNE